jgi:uncharacterized protein YndB with AHSA1/START domain
MQKEIKQMWSLDRAPEEVWGYLTRPELLEKWLAKTDFQPVVGHKFHFNGKGKVIYCQVLEVRPFTQLAYSWQTTSASAGERLNSKVLWTLQPKGDGTELHLLHTGFIVAEDLAEHLNGWTKIVNKISEQLNGIDHDNRHA